MSKELVNAEGDLSTLAQQINEEHQKVTEALKAGLEHAVRAGELLIQTKEKVAHGKWLPWLEENCKFSERTAQAYMRVAREFPKLKAQRVADLSFRQTIALLQQPKAFEIHPVSEIFPAMTPEEFQRLVESIKDHGLNDPIALSSDGRIVDGKERYRACLEAGVEPRFKTLPEDTDLLSYAMDMNIHRQHLTEDQRACVAVEYLNLVEDEQPWAKAAFEDQQLEVAMATFQTVLPSLETRFNEMKEIEDPREALRVCVALAAEASRWQNHIAERRIRLQRAVGELVMSGNS